MKDMTYKAYEIHKETEAIGPEADELREMASDRIGDALAPEITIVTAEEQEWDRIGEKLLPRIEPAQINPRDDDRLLYTAPVNYDQNDELWFAEGIKVEHILRRQGLDSSTGDEIDVKELAALAASEDSRR